MGLLIASPEEHERIFRPQKVFYCFENKLASLEGCPKEVGVSFVCGDNPLESFEGYKGDFNRLVCLNKIKLIRKTKLKIIEKL